MSYNNGKVGIYSVFVELILLNAFVSLTGRIYPSWIPLGKLIGGLIILTLLIIYCKSLKLADVCFLTILSLFSILPIINSTNMGETSEHVINFFTSMLLLWKASSHTFRNKLLNTMNHSKQLINMNIRLSIIVLIISLLFPSSYMISNDEKVFWGLSMSNHILCGTVSFYMSLLLVYLYDKKIKLKHLFYYGVYILVILMAGARTYLITVICYLVALYFLKLRTYSLRYLIIPSGIIATIYAFFNSSAYLRFISTSQNQYISSNIFEAMTSGRIIWWKIDIEKYMKFPLLERLFGAGHSIVYEINETYYNMRIWAHNDFVQLLLAIGIIGVLFYIYVLVRFLWNIRKAESVKGVKFPTLIVLGSFIINAIFNGYYVNIRLNIATILLTLLLFKNEKVLC